jgi:hypothetical protein
MRANDHPTAAALDAMIAELVASSAQLAQAASENAAMLAGLLAERRAAPPDDAASISLSPELVKLVTDQAGAVGMRANDHLHEAVLAAIALRRDRDLQARVREAHRARHAGRGLRRAVPRGRRSRVARRRRRAP